MSGAAPPDGDPQEVELRRLRHDLADVMFENARLRQSVAERQAEIVALSERLGALQTRLDGLSRATAWVRFLRFPGARRLLLRRR